MSQRKVSKACITVSAIILVIVIALNVAVVMFAELLDKWVVGYSNSSSPAQRAKGKTLAEQIQVEGSVLVKNDNATLPLENTETKKVNVFGWAATDWVISGSGSGQVINTDCVYLLDALENYGVQYNTEIINMYESYRANRNRSQNGTQFANGFQTSGTLHSFNYEYSRLYEPSITDTSRYSANMLANAKEFSDTAIVVIGRTSGESNDSPKVQYKDGTSSQTPSDSTRTYLEISTEEEALLNYVGENYEKVIVLINSTNVMELGFLDTIEGLDSCLIVATTGQYGAGVIPQMLYGEATPSGKLADTYAYDLTTNPTYVNTGSGNDTTNFYTNSSGLYPTNVQHTNGSSNEAYRGVAYTDYAESVYVGYKWYETADTMGFWDSDFAKTTWGIENGYEDVVQYPFGYGLSYTKFEWTITYLEQLEGATLKESDVIKVGVNVKNVGSAAGQDVVQLYYSAPYNTDGIEKASVNLGAFGKTTNVLQPGETEYVELEMTVGDMASYDCYDLSGIVSGGGYVLEEGAYTLTLRTDSHTLATLATGGKHDGATITYNVADDIAINYDLDTDYEVRNRFTGEDTTDGVAIDGNSDGTAEITYLSRAAFENTFPAELVANRAMHADIKALNLYTASMANNWAATHAGSDITFGDKSTGDVVYENGQINDLGRELGDDYNAEAWDDVLNRITKNEMTNLVLHGYTKTSKIDSIGKPETRDLDGPNQIGSFVEGNKYGATGFSTIVLAQSWNVELAYSLGLTVGEECNALGISGWYGPATNVHRSPFGGRNYEYYSEDALLSGLMCAKTVQAAKNKGVFCYLKHLALYESESGRDGMYTWCTEQALREIYIKPFEISVKKGGSTGIMTSYGRIGAVWTGGSEALLTEVVRGEWGFQGAFLTDYADHHDFMNGDQMLRAGGDLWMDGFGNNGSFRSSFDTSSNAFNTALRSATKNILYMWLNALSTNATYNEMIASGEIDDTISIPQTPQLNFRWYIPVVIALDVLAVVGCGLWITTSVKKAKRA